jgi:hypothetical protein
MRVGFAVADLPSAAVHANQHRRLAEAHAVVLGKHDVGSGRHLIFSRRHLVSRDSDRLTPLGPAIN